MITAQRRKRRVFILGLLLGAGVIALGVLQFRWISTAAIAEEEEARRTMLLSAARAVDAANDEVRALMTFLHVPVDRIGTVDPATMEVSLVHWKENTLFPGLLESAHLIVSADRINLYRVDDEGASWVAVQSGDGPEGLDLGTIQNDEELRRVLFRRDESGTIVLPLYGPHSPERPNVYLQIRLNVDVYLTEILPYYADLLMPSYLYRITHNQETAALSPGLAERRDAADVALPLSWINQEPGTEIVVRDRLRRGERQEHDQKEDRPAVSAYAPGLISNPVIRYWYFTATRDEGPGPLSVLDPTRMQGQGGVFHIYTPDRSLVSAISLRKYSNLGISIGLLALLVAAFVVLYRLYDRAERLRAREKEFISTVTHELRTPLSVIGATSSNLVDGIIADPEGTKRYGRLIRSQVGRLHRMIESSLLYSRLEARADARPIRVAVELRTIMEEVLEACTPPAEEAGAVLSAAALRLPETVFGDPTALRIIAENLLINAIRHGRPPSPQQASVIRFTMRFEPPQRLYIVVEDDGSGVPSDEQREIFKPFYRGTASSMEQRQGSGLGLHLVARIVGLQGGTIKVESPYEDEDGGRHTGARFTAMVRVNRGIPQ